MFNHKPLMVLVTAIFLVIFASSALAKSETEQQEESFSQPLQKLTGRVGDVPVYSHIYGANFMTEQERCNYLLQLDSMKTKEKRDAFRAKHHDEIDLRKKETGG